jgi:Mn2+/Fe2+ NRAMP family transporter
MAGTGLPVHSLFPFASVTFWGNLSGLVGAALVWLGRYAVFEKVCAALVARRFVTMVGAAALTLPNLGELLRGLVPTMPAGSMLNVLSVAGGVGTITLAADGYWLREKGWTTPRHMKVMRLDNRVAYLATGIFVVSTLIVGAELLHSAKIAVQTGDKGLLDLATVLDDRYGTWGEQGLPRRLLVGRDVFTHRCLERRLDDVRRLHGSRAGP